MCIRDSYYQFQVILKPSPDNVQDLYLDSLRAIGIPDVYKRQVQGAVRLQEGAYLFEVVRLGQHLSLIHI